MNKPFDRRGVPRPRATFEGDRHAWAMEQAALLRAGRLGEADAARIAEVLDWVVSDEYDRLEGAPRVVLMHMLTWDHQPGRRGRSWANPIRTQRRHALRALRKSPSLKSWLEEALREGYEDARVEASSETDLPLRTVPERSPEWPASDASLSAASTAWTSTSPSPPRRRPRLREPDRPVLLAALGPRGARRRRSQPSAELA